MAEPLTSLTDYVIALEALLFTLLLWQRGKTGWLWGAAFASVSIAALLGGTHHGFNPVLSYRQQLWLWQGMQLALAGASFWIVVAVAWECQRSLHFWQMLLLAFLKLLIMVVLGYLTLNFALSVVDYLLALGLVLLVDSRRFRPQTTARLTWIGLGVGGSSVAALVLLGSWPATLNLSPAVGYHLIQIGALYCLYRGVSSCVR